MESLFWAALSNAVVASLLAVTVAVVARICRRPTVVHALWLLILLKLLTPPLVPLPMSWLRTTDATPVVAESPSPAPSLPPLGERAEPLASLAETPEEAVAPEPDFAPADPPRAIGWSCVVMICWLCGSLIWWTIAGARVIRFHRLLRAARTAPETVQEQARRLAASLGLRRCPPVSFVSAPLSPMLWALGFSPRLLVPVELWQRLCVQQQDTLLAHELAHLRRGDHWVRRLEFVVLGLYWWHPVVWWARRRLQEAEEECCDARVVAMLPDAASAYASVLVETVAFLSQTRAAARLGASGAGQVPLLKRRLTMILTANPSGKSSRVAFWSVLGLGALLLPLTPGSAQPEAPAPLEQPAAGEAKPEGAEQRDTLFHQHRVEVQKCASCHQPATVHARDLRQKPRSWKEAHDELVRKMEEMKIAKAKREFEAAVRSREREQVVSKAQWAFEEHERAEQIEKLQDEIELLKVQVRLKQVHLEAAKSDVLAAERTLKIVEAARNTMPVSQFVKAEAELVAQKAQIRIREAELQEPLVRLQQAERRLARLQPPAKKAAEGEGGSFYKDFDFGTVARGTLLACRVPISNPTKQAIRIASIRTSSGCLSASTEKDDIPPGGQTIVHVKMDTGRFTGSKTAKVYIQFADQQRPEVYWQFHAISRDDAPTTGGREQKEQRLRELENKVKQLLEEMKALQRELRPQKPGTHSYGNTFDPFGAEIGRSR